MGRDIPPFTNYADFVIRIATHPSLEELDYSIRGLARENTKNYRHHSVAEEDREYNKDLTIISEKRKVSFLKQF